MKKIFSFTFMFACSLGLVAQMPQLPEILQEKINQEQLDLTINYEDETENENPAENYYRFIERTLGNDTLLGYRWNRETEEWVLRARIIKMYNDDELVTGKYFQIYNHQDSTWREGLYFQYDYNSNGDLTELLIQYWNQDSSVWVNHFKKMNTYNDEGSLTAILTQWWSVRKKEWVNHQQKLFTWDEGLLIADTVKIHHFMADGWINHHYSTYSYNDAGMKTTRTFFIWSHHYENWVKKRRFNYNYDDSTGYLANVVSQMWRGDDIGWKNQYRFNYTYDSNENVTVYLFEFWNHYHEEWIEKVKIDYEYNDQGLMSHFVRQHKYLYFDGWINVKQASFQYDDNGNMIEKIVQLWNRHHEEWVNYRKWEMLLQYKMVAGIGDHEQPNIQAVYPNPYRPGEAITFTGLENGTYRLQLFDINGRLLETKTIEQRTRTGFSKDLHNGLYIMVLSDNNKVLLTSKLLVAH